ncbi:nucleotidyltransferase [uncultured Aquimarina sp.]|uniref:nucleotidyltransferase domain-containing protein n=1 Tax=uncultured Aquimarina sp. TaxID=575652 RepID=UPI00262E3A75|nr:nucleotidyltransferase [uncultured Aquimarina sp.]
MNMTELYKNEVAEILETLGENLDISESQYKEAVKSYQAVGEWLSCENSSLYPYKPNILPQGSFMLGTMTKPINDEDDIDIDLVCKIQNKPSHWTQKHLKEAIGDRLKEHSRYEKMLKEKGGGRRCWTIIYAEDSNFHMDILPSLADENLNIILNEKFFSTQNLDADKLAIRITDKEHIFYSIMTDRLFWIKSNPFGYAKWFFQKAIVSEKRIFSLRESIDPVRPYQKKKLPLQRVVQLLKRHRDIMFSSDDYNSENKPISIIITTLASRAYDKSENIVDAYINVINRMRGLIETKLNEKTGKYEKWISNPVNEEENFADKWVEEPQKEEYFYGWLDKLEKDIQSIRYGAGKGLQILNESLSKQYGNKAVQKTFAIYGEKNRLLRETGERKMAVGTGILGSTGKTVPNHNFEGIE